MLRPRHHRALLAGLLLALASAPAWARLPTWVLDPVHTRVLLAVDHAGFSSALGTLSGATGTLHYAPGDWSGAQVEVEIPLQRLDFGDAAWNRATLGHGLLDAQAHPVAYFRSTRVDPVDADHARVTGLLQLRGIEREVVLDVRLNAARRHPLPPFRRTVGFSATTVISRGDFGIDAWRSMIGDRVELRIEAEATRGRGATAGHMPAGPAADAEPPAPVPGRAPVPGADDAADDLAAAAAAAADLAATAADSGPQPSPMDNPAANQDPDSPPSPHPPEPEP